MSVFQHTQHSAAALQVAAARIRCHSFLSGKEAAPGAQAVGIGSACLHCPAECRESAGATSLLVGSVEAISGVTGEVTLTWRCPGCGIQCHEPSSALNAFKLSAEIAADSRCHRCRRTTP